MPVTLPMAVLAAGGAAAWSANNSAGKAANAAAGASQTQAQSQQEALDYLKQRNALPDAVRDKALTQLQGYYSGGKDQSDLIANAMNSPFYKQVMGTLDAGNRNIERTASATGGLRSGQAVGALTNFGQQTAARALTGSVDQQLTGLEHLAGTPTNDQSIADAIAGIGKTNAAGITAGAQADQQGDQNSINNLLGFGNLALKSYFASLDPNSKVSGFNI